MENSKIGPTGKFPDEKLNEDDEGELAFGIIIKDNRLILFFNKPITWLGFTKEDTKNLIDILSQEIQNF